MIYIQGILLVALILSLLHVLLKRLLPPTYFQWMWSVFVMALMLNFAMAPYRLTRIWNDVSHLIG